MKFIVVAAMANNNVIGENNELLWHMPADLKRFKEITMGHTILMGRKTFESIGKPLPGRNTVVISRNRNYDAQGCQVYTSLKDAICELKNEKEVFVIGGAEIYRQVINLYLTRRMYITRIYANFEGDSFFPDIPADKWELIEHEEKKPDNKNPYPYTFQIYKKRSRSKKPSSL